MKTAWALWDCGSAAFNAVLVTFIFSVYLTDSVGATIDASQTPSFYYSIALAIAGFAIALVAPVMGQRADARGTRRKSLILWTLVTIGLMASLFLVRNDAALWFWVGITIMAVASITFEFAEVNYFAMLNQISTPATVGRISGVGWALGYVGGIVVLLLCFILFISGEGGAFGLPTEAGLNIRLVALFAATWFLLAALPYFSRHHPPRRPANNSPGLAPTRNCGRPSATCGLTTAIPPTSSSHPLFSATGSPAYSRTARSSR